MKKNSKIYIAGHRGLVGSAIWKNLEKKGYTNLIGKSHKELDLLDRIAVKDFFDKEKPEYVILAAAYVGGIMANNIYRADFIYKNLQIQQNVIGESFNHKIKKLLFLGSTCIYPKNAPQPMKEEVLLTSPLEYTNEPYAIAKIAGLKMCESFNMQYGTNYIAVMPTNLYGPNDNFDLTSSHVMPAIIRKMFLADALYRNDWDFIKKDLQKVPINKIDNTCTQEMILQTLNNYGIYNNKLILWGTGKPLREFLWSEDMADASVYILEHVNYQDLNRLTSELQGLTTIKMHKEGFKIPEIRNCHINIGTGKEISINKLANFIKETIGYKGTIEWDDTKPDGTMRKLINVDKLNNLGWKHKIEIDEGVKLLINWYSTH